MKRYIVCCDTGYVGMTEHKPLIMPDDHTDGDLAEAAWELAADHAQAYGIEYDEDADEDDYMNDNIGGTAELYDPAKHDMLRPGGGSFVLDFEYMER